MTCSDAYEAILEADLIELDGTGEGPLAKHLESCPRCRAMADAVLAQESALARNLAGMVPEIDLNRLLQPDETTDAPNDAREGPSAHEPVASFLPRLRRFRRSALALSPLAAAAVLAALFLGRSPGLPGPVYQPPERVAAVEVEFPEGRSGAVLETDNPEITVLWLF